MTKNKTRFVDRGIMPVIVLVLVCGICTGLLAFTNQVTLPIREAERQARLDSNRRQIFPEAAEFQQIDIPSEGLTDKDHIHGLYQAVDGSGQDLGLLAETSAQGYGGQVNIMAGIGLDGKIVAVRILDNEETPGLGKKIEAEKFYRQFDGQEASGDFAPGQGQFDAISGATISSKAVANALNLACQASKVLEGVQ